MKRAELIGGGNLSTIQLIILSLLSNGHNYIDISERLVAEGLKVSPSTVKYHVYQAAEKIPGDLPMQMKAVVWYRGAPKEVLTGEWVRQMNKRGFEK